MELTPSTPLSLSGAQSRASRLSTEAGNEGNDADDASNTSVSRSTTKRFRLTNPPEEDFGGPITVQRDGKVYSTAFNTYAVADLDVTADHWSNAARAALDGRVNGLMRFFRLSAYLPAPPATGDEAEQASRKRLRVARGYESWKCRACGVMLNPVCGETGNARKHISLRKCSGLANPLEPALLTDPDEEVRQTLADAKTALAQGLYAPGTAGGADESTSMVADGNSADEADKSHGSTLTRKRGKRRSVRNAASDTSSTATSTAPQGSLMALATTSAGPQASFDALPSGTQPSTVQASGSTNHVYVDSSRAEAGKSNGVQVELYQPQAGATLRYVGKLIVPTTSSSVTIDARADDPYLAGSSSNPMATSNGLKRTHLEPNSIESGPPPPPLPLSTTNQAYSLEAPPPPPAPSGSGPSGQARAPSATTVAFFLQSLGLPPQYVNSAPWRSLFSGVPDMPSFESVRDAMGLFNDPAQQQQRRR